MEAFAYWKETPSGGLRWGALIVANGDERIVDNAVLKNPGSAAPVESLFGEREDGRVLFFPDPTIESTRRAALKTDFNMNFDAPETAEGTITYTFKKK